MCVQHEEMKSGEGTSSGQADACAGGLGQEQKEQKKG